MAQEGGWASAALYPYNSKRTYSTTIQTFQAPVSPQNLIFVARLAYQCGFRGLSSTGDRRNKIRIQHRRFGFPPKHSLSSKGELKSYLCFLKHILIPIAGSAPRWSTSRPATAPASLPLPPASSRLNTATRAAPASLRFLLLSTYVRTALLSKIKASYRAARPMASSHCTSTRQRGCSRASLSI